MVILITVPPSVGVAPWMTGVGAVPELHLTVPLMFIPVALDAYAFAGTNMFDSNLAA